MKNHIYFIYRFLLLEYDLIYLIQKILQKKIK